MGKATYFYMPNVCLMGVGCLSNLGKELISRGYKKALIVTDKNLVRVGHVGKVEEILKENNIEYTIFDGVEQPNPNVTFVENGLKYLKEKNGMLKKNYDFLISIGGGTNCDTATSIAAIATNGGSVVDYEGLNKYSKPMLPVVAVNTTAGSGAHVTMLDVITDDTRKTKMSIVDPKIMPTISINDPLLHLTAPKETTIASGIDVLCHAVEAYVATNAFPFSDALALQAMKLFINNIRKVVANGNDLDARDGMAYAAAMASAAFNNAGLGYLHAIIHQIGGYSYRLHGLVCGAFLPYVLEFNAPAVPVQRFIDMANALEIEDISRTNVVDKVIDTMKELNADLGIPADLTELLEMDASDRNIKAIAEMALKDLSCLTNPRQGTIDDVMALIKKFVKAQSGQKEKERELVGV